MIKKEKFHSFEYQLESEIFTEISGKIQQVF